MTYQFEVTIKTDNTPEILSINRKFENSFQAQKELTNIGINGLIFTNESGQKYFPPHRILEIDFKEIN